MTAERCASDHADRRAASADAAAAPRRSSPPQGLSALAAAARACRRCVEAPEGAPLPQEPRPLFAAARSARICIASQAPGNRAHETGIPFNDPSGVRLRQWLAVTEQEFYDASRIAILPMSFCYPGRDPRGADLPPRRECAPLWRERFFAGLPRLRLILCVGQYAQAYHLGRQWRGSLGETMRHWRETLSASDRPAMLPLPHPSWRNTVWLKRNPWFEEELLPCLQSEIRRHLQERGS